MDAHQDWCNHDRLHMVATNGWINHEGAHWIDHDGEDMNGNTGSITMARTRLIMVIKMQM